MGYEKSKLGDAGYFPAGGATNVTLNVSNRYGAFSDTLDVTAGVINTEGSINELTLHLTPATIVAQDFALYAKPFIPASSKVINAYVEVSEVFTITGTTPVVSIGTTGSEVTNGIDITEAQLEALGVYDVTSTLAGTWAAAAGGLTARTVVDIANSAGLGVTGSLGKAKVVIRYIHV